MIVDYRHMDLKVFHLIGPACSLIPQGVGDRSVQASSGEDRIHPHPCGPMELRVLGNAGEHGAPPSISDKDEEVSRSRPGRRTSHQELRHDHQGRPAALGRQPCPTTRGHLAPRHYSVSCGPCFSYSRRQSMTHCGSSILACGLRIILVHMSHRTRSASIVPDWNKHIPLTLVCKLG